MLRLGVVAAERDSSQPVKVPWNRRTKGVMPLVGGYRGYLDSLRQVADILRDGSLPKVELVVQAADHLGISAKSAELRVGYLTKVGFLLEDRKGLHLPQVIKTWLLDRDSTPLLVTMHMKIQFVGEMLKALDAPMATAGLRDYANQQYLMGWSTNNQIDHRRGWLQSAGLMGRRNDGVLYRTHKGTAFLECVAVEPSFGGLGVRRATTEAMRRAAHVSWEDRASGVLPMPGGYDGYMDSLRWLAESLEEAPLTRAEFARRMANRFKLTGTSVETRVSFLQKVGFLRIDSGNVVLPDFMKSWLRDGDSTRVIVKLHLGAQFVGEMLKALEEPTTTVELHALACEQYSMGWETPTQIENRRGWLQSAGLIRYDKPGRHLYRTDKGTDFLDLVSVEAPFSTTPGQTAGRSDAGSGGTAVSGHEVAEEDPRAEDPAPDQMQADHGDPIAELIDRIVDASTDSSNPSAFEVAVCDAFRFLGFDAELLGGSGQTDVLLTARFGSGASYRVAVDAKTAGSGRLTDQQVDWITLRDHRGKHQVEYSMIIGPSPSGERLFNRAQDQDVAVLSARSLADMCRSHAAQPLGLANYRDIFLKSGDADVFNVEKRSHEAKHLVALAKRLLDTIRDETERFGEHFEPVTARDLYRVLVRDEGTIIATEREIQALLNTLASPLVSAVQGDPDTGYVLACRPDVTAERLRILGDAIASDSESDPNGAE